MLSHIWWTGLRWLFKPVFYIVYQAQRNDLVLIPLIIAFVAGMLWTLHVIVHALNAFPNTIR